MLSPSLLLLYAEQRRGGYRVDAVRVRRGGGVIGWRGGGVLIGVVGDVHDGGRLLFSSFFCGFAVSSFFSLKFKCCPPFCAFFVYQSYLLVVSVKLVSITILSIRLWSDSQKNK